MASLNCTDLDVVSPLEHHSERPAAELPEAGAFVGRKNDPPRRMLEETVPVKSRSISDPMWFARENCSNRERDVLGGGAGAKRAKRAHDVVAAGNAVDHAPANKAREEIRRSLWRELAQLFHFPSREGLLALHSKFV